LSDRQVRWWEFLSRFNFNTVHVDGVENKVADCLSRYYKSDTSDDNHPDHVFMNADAHLDPDKARITESAALNEGSQKPTSVTTSRDDDNDDVRVIAAGNDGVPLRQIFEQGMDLSKVLRDAYHRDTMFVKTMAHPDAHPRFVIRDGLIWT
ncbi:hypothetical protein JB92DRAFT_2615281, partial [Gautieria morchelliformis]